MEEEKCNGQIVRKMKKKDVTFVDSGSYCGGVKTRSWSIDTSISLVLLSESIDLKMHAIAIGTPIVGGLPMLPPPTKPLEPLDVGSQAAALPATKAIGTTVHQLTGCSSSTTTDAYC